MNITSISVSYVFLVILIINLLCFLYFKLLFVSSSKENKKHDTIVGNMKDPDSWRKTNNRMSYTSLFWSLISLILFIYTKFFLNSMLINIFIPFAYIFIIIISFLVLSRKK